MTAGSAADAAGLEEGDLITAIDGAEVTSAEALVSELRARAPGDTVTLSVVRAGEALSLDAVLGNRADVA